MQFVCLFKKIITMLLCCIIVCHTVPPMVVGWVIWRGLACVCVTVCVCKQVIVIVLYFWKYHIMADGDTLTGFCEGAASVSLHCGS